MQKLERDELNFKKKLEEKQQRREGTIKMIQKINKDYNKDKTFA